MGSELCKGNELPQRLQVFSIPDSVPPTPQYRIFRGCTTRYSDLSVVSADSITYIFTLKIQEHRELQVALPVLNEIAHRAVYINYKLDILSKIILDPIDPSFSSTLISVKNDVTGVEFSLRIIPFKSYNSAQFKKALQEVWIHQNKLTKRQRNVFLTLNDAFIYGVNPDQQALVLLFQRTNSSLFDVGEYRREANWPWTLPQKLTIFQHLLQGCQKLREMKLIHRDVRPGNIFFLQHLNRYVLGNFSTARESHEYLQDDLMTVYGVQALASEPLSHLIAEKTNMGIYNINDNLYENLIRVLNYLQTMNTAQNGRVHFQQKIIQDIMLQLRSRNHFNSIIAYITRQTKELVHGNIELFQDHLISKLTQKVLTAKYKQISDQYQFKTYEVLGYYKQFSQVAHKIIQRNNINQQPFKNAYIMKNLGSFYQQNGSGGIEYTLNSCILFCKQVEIDLQYRMLDDAEEHLEQAEELYLKLSTTSDFTLNLIQINRLKALLKIHRGKNDPNQQAQAIRLINKTLTLAGDKNLPIQKQMKLFLSWGIIYRQSGQVQLAQQRLKNGLSICENAAAFTSPSIALLFKSHFMYQLGVIYFNKMKELHKPQLPLHEQQYNKFDYKGRAESYFKLSLQIRQRQYANSFQIIENHLILGSFYLMQNNYVQSKSHYKKGLIKLQLIKDKICDDILIQLNYDLGSVCYKLRQFKDAQIYYKQAIKILEQTQSDEYWKYCIMGNLALARIQSGEIEDGTNELQRVKEIIRLKNGSDHYDYIFLQTQQNLIRGRNTYDH